MKKTSFRDYIPYVAAILIFVLITLIYFNPLLQGKKLKQEDIMRFKGMSKEIVDYREKTGEEPLWTNSMFGGMPAFQISVRHETNLFRYIDKVLMLGLPRPAGYVFLYLLGFFILMLVLRVNPWLAIAGAIAFAFSSYFFIVIEAGHNSKAHAIGYMAPVLAGIILTYRRKYILGGILTAFFLALEIRSNHPQITYYLLMVVIILGIFEFYHSIREKQLIHFFKATGILLLAAVFAGLTHFSYLWITYEHGKKTIRGKSELTINQENQTSGLDKDYATAWSYGVSETFSLMIPNTKGGATDALANNKKALDKVDRQFRKAVAGQNQYWGDQPFTSGPVYVGAIVIFLFVLGLLIIKKRFKWILLVAVILSILLSWGKNFMPFTDFFLDYIPGYNKFRAVSMTLVIAELCIPILAFLALNEIIKNPDIIKEKRKQFYIAFGITGGLSLIFYLFPNLFFDFLSQQEVSQFNEYKRTANAAQINKFIDNLESARIAIFKSDAIRSFLYILIAAAVLWLYSINKIGKRILIPAFIFLILVDMATITYRYLNSDNFVRKSRMTTPYQASIADQEIIKDPDLDFRVLNLTVSTFNDASTSYFHKSVGGYHGAKLRRYQEFIDYGIQPEISELTQVLKTDPNYGKINNVLKNSHILNMLNTKYIIIDPAQPPFLNKYALGNAWFVNNYKIVDNADQEIMALQSFKPDQTAIIDNDYSKYIGNYTKGMDSLARIRLTNYKPNELTYKFISSKDQLTVFSEIYYKDGWNAYVDGKLSPHFRVNYVLRAMIIPAGEHNIVFKFEPQIYYTGRKVSLFSSIFLIILILAGTYYVIRNEIKQ